MKSNAFSLVIAGVTTGTLTAGLMGLGFVLELSPAQLIWPGFAAGFMLGLVAQYIKSSLLVAIDNRAQTLRRKLERLHRTAGDVHGLVRLGPYTEKLPLPFGGGWALTGDSAAILAREVILRKPATVVELGSGVSTLVVGQILARQGTGKLISVDHDAEWAARTRANVMEVGLESVVTVIHAPLTQIDAGGRQSEWYDLDPDLLASIDQIDFLIVDGPPQKSREKTATRFPAFPVFRDKLSPKAIVFVDDAARSTESSMIKEWLGLYDGWKAEFYDTVDGVSLLTWHDPN